jgi:hypothetical protein
MDECGFAQILSPFFGVPKIYVFFAFESAKSPFILTWRSSAGRRAQPTLVGREPPNVPSSAKQWHGAETTPSKQCI